MKQISEEHRLQLAKNGEPNNRDQDHPPVIKLFLPGTGCTWLLSELDHEEPTIAFGLCDLGLGFPELGYVSLVELDEIRSPGLNLPVECDLHFKAKHPMSVYAEAARMCDAITLDDGLLTQAAAICNSPPFRLD